MSILSGLHLKGSFPAIALSLATFERLEEWKVFLQTRRTLGAGQHFTKAVSPA